MHEVISLSRPDKTCDAATPAWGESLGASVSMGCSRPFDLQVHKRAHSYRYGCPVRIAQVTHAARGRLRGGELGGQRLNGLF